MCLLSLATEFSNQTLDSQKLTFFVFTVVLLGIFLFFLSTGFVNKRLSLRSKLTKSSIIFIKAKNSNS